MRRELTLVLLALLLAGGAEWLHRQRWDHRFDPLGSWRSLEDKLRAIDDPREALGALEFTASCRGSCPPDLTRGLVGVMVGDPSLRPLAGEMHWWRPGWYTSLHTALPGTVLSRPPHPLYSGLHELERRAEWFRVVKDPDLLPEVIEDLRQLLEAPGPDHTATCLAALEVFLEAREVPPHQQRLLERLRLEQRLVGDRRLLLIDRLQTLRGALHAAGSPAPPREAIEELLELVARRRRALGLPLPGGLPAQPARDRVLLAHGLASTQRSLTWLLLLVVLLRGVAGLAARGPQPGPVPRRPLARLLWVLLPAGILCLPGGVRQGLDLIHVAAVVVLLCMVGATWTARPPGARGGGGWLPTALLVGLAGVTALAVGYLWPGRAPRVPGPARGAVMGAILLLGILLPFLAGLRRARAGRGAAGPWVLLSVVLLSASLGLLRSLEYAGVGTEVQAVLVAALLWGLLYWLLRRALPGAVRLREDRLRPGPVILVGGLLLAVLAWATVNMQARAWPDSSEASRALCLYLVLLCLPALEYATLPAAAPWLRPTGRALTLGLLSLALLKALTTSLTVLE